MRAPIRRHRVLAALGVLGTTLFVAPTTASAATEDGLWYLDDTGVAAAHQTTTGTGVRIALIDRRVNTSVNDLAGTRLTVREPSYCAESEGGAALPATSSSADAQHATGMASILVGSGAGLDGVPGVLGVAPGADVVAYANIIDNDACPAPAGDGGGPAAAFRDAVADGADIVVVPGTTTIRDSDYVAAIQSGVIVVAAGGNDGGPVSGIPATNNGAVTTGTTAQDGSLDPSSPTGPSLGVVAPGARFRTLDPTFSFYGVVGGSSNSSTFTAGVLALAMSAHPDATGNQVLQALVRTTGGSVHEPARDDTRGFGAVDVPTLLSVDPTTFPDENPFVSDASDAFPSADDLGVVASSPVDEATDTSTTAPSEDGASQDADASPWLFVIGGIAVLVIGVVVTIAIVASRRRGRAARQTNQAGGHHG